MDAHSLPRSLGHALTLLLLATALTVPTVSVTATAAGARPNTTITSGPSGAVASRKATFRFRSSKRRSTFQCRLDGKRWRKCTSPKTYGNLAQGRHTVRVRARKNGAVDKTPARRTFTVDTRAPATTITAGPVGTTHDHTPTFTFGADEPATFICVLDSVTYAACTSPFTSPTPLGDGDHRFTVAAMDAAGNRDVTPAVRTFAVETPLTDDLATAQEAARMYFPDSLTMDIPVVCNPAGVSLDCPGGSPIPAADQITMTAVRDVVAVEGADAYDVTAALDVSTLVAPVLSYAGLDCALTLDSGGGETPTWTVGVRLQVLQHEPTGTLRLDALSPTVSGIEDGDWSLSGGFGCTALEAAVGVAVPQLVTQVIGNWMTAVGDPLCAAPGPAYLGPCPLE